MTSNGGASQGAAASGAAGSAASHGGPPHPHWEQWQHWHHHHGGPPGGFPGYYNYYYKGCRYGGGKIVLALVAGGLIGYWATSKRECGRNYWMHIHNTPSDSSTPGAPGVPTAPSVNQEQKTAGGFWK